MCTIIFRLTMLQAEILIIPDNLGPITFSKIINQGTRNSPISCQVLVHHFLMDQEYLDSFSAQLHVSSNVHQLAFVMQL